MLRSGIVCKLLKDHAKNAYDSQRSFAALKKGHEKIVRVFFFFLKYEIKSQQNLRCNQFFIDNTMKDFKLILFIEHKDFFLGILFVCK